MADAAKPPASAAPGPLTGLRHPWVRRLLLLAVMIGLALAGMAVSSAYSTAGKWMWSGIVLIFGGICLYLSVANARAAKTPVLPVVVKNCLHWFGLFAVLKILLVLVGMEFVNEITAANMGILFIALTCYFAGVHFDWIFYLVAILLADIAYVNAYVTERLWLIIIVSAVLAFGVGAAFLWLARRREARTKPGT